MPQPVRKPQITDVDGLYGLPLTEFTPERNALAKRLRADGDRDAAGDVAGARKPTTPAWAVNQLVREEPDRVRELISVGEELREAQARLVAGDGGELLALSERERGLVDDLVESASGILQAGGQRPSDATLDQIRETLHAAALDPEAAEAVGSGRLTKERRAVGFGLAGAPVTTGRAPARGKPPQREAPPKPVAKPASKRQPSARVRKARERLAAARSAADEAGRRAGETDARLADAQQEADAAARAVRRAEGKARQARKAAEQAEARERKAAEALELLASADADD
jgi:hypothetical protein